MRIIALLTLLLIYSGCNEQIAPELTEAANTTTSTPSVNSFKQFSLSETSPSLLGYHLHQTGAGLGLEDCTINQQTYDTDTASDPQFDITCYLEAEEQGLYFNGLNFQLNVDAGACEYVAFAPYSFYRLPPGRATGTFIVTTCDGNPSTTPGGGRVCETIADTANAITLAAGSADLVEQHLCPFNYSNYMDESLNPPNCDLGTHTVQYENCSYDDDAAVTSCDITTEVLECGGRSYNCIDGPIRNFSVLDETTRGGLIYQVPENSSFSESWELESPYDRGLNSNILLSNYTRQCVSTVNSGTDTNFSNVTTFNADIMDYYADNTTQDPTSFNVASNLYNPYVQGAANVLIYADDPFLGSSRTTPYYSWYCLDSALDIKARIRVAVRDWDRTFNLTGAGNVELVSDVGDNVFPTTISRMDSFSSAQENEYDTDPHFPRYNAYNDYEDWDDFLEFVDTPTAAPLTCQGIEGADQDDGPKGFNAFPGLSR